MAKCTLTWLLAGCVALTSALAHAAEESAGKVQRSAVTLRYGDAKALAEIITKHFKGPGEVQVLAEPKTNSLLISSSEKVHAEVVKLVAELDRRPKTVAVDVLIVDLRTKKGEEAKLDKSTFRGPSAEVMKRVEELRKKGIITGSRRFKLTALENEPISLMTGEMKPSVVGVAGGFGGRGGGASSRSINYRDLGTSVDVTVRLTGDKESQVNLSITDSRDIKPEGGVVLGKDENGGSILAPEYTNTRLKTRLSVPVGHAAPVQTTEGESTASHVQSIVIVSTRIVEATSGK